MKTFLSLFFILFIQIVSFCSPNEIDCFNNAAVVAKVESFTNSGFFNCSFECFLDMKYTKFEEEPIICFQVGTIENPTAFKNKILTKEYLETLQIEQEFSNSNYKLKINFGKIKVKPGFIARLVIIQNGKTRFIPLKASNYKDEITKMNQNDDTLCKAEQFLRKIQFDRLYDEDYFEDVVLSKK